MRMTRMLKGEVDRMVTKAIDALLTSDHPLVRRLDQIDQLRRLGHFDRADLLEDEIEDKYGLTQLRADIYRDVERRVVEWVRTFGRDQVPRAQRLRWLDRRTPTSDRLLNTDH